jgi:hypothetical protein
MSTAWKTWTGFKKKFDMKHGVNSLWLKASVAGGLWASFEIIVGSMLHNLHLPFSGSMMATFSVILMVAFTQVWKSPGMIWRAGLICGLMKSLSPSAVILGPMTGIMMEAVIIYLMVFLLGMNLLGYMMAGIGALLSAILHKLASLFILYGSDLVTIYVNLFEYLKKQMGLERVDPGDLIILITGIYIGVGILAALTGFLIGRKAAIRPRMATIEHATGARRADWKEIDPAQPFRIVLFFLHCIMIPLLLFLINRFGLSWSSMIPAAIYSGFLMLYYKNIVGRLSKPFFWSQLLLMTLIAGIFWIPPETGTVRYGNGWLVGVEMSIRAVLIVSAFSALSVEIRNPRITGSLLRWGMGNAYGAISLAFSSLPVMLDRSADPKAFFRNPSGSFTAMIAEAKAWLHHHHMHLKG